MRFFNKIRKSFIFSENFIKYMLYATGEIILVIIGILIALQVNNWNENRKKEELEIKLLSEVLNPIKEDEKGLEFAIDFYEKKQKLVKQIKNALESNSTNKDSLALQLGEVSLLFAFRTDHSIFESIKAAGLNNIKNDSIRILLPLYYFTANDIKEIHTQFDVANYFREFIYPQYFESFDYGLGAFPKNIDTLRRSSEVKVALDYVYNDARYYTWQYYTLISTNRKLQEKIKFELENRIK